MSQRAVVLNITNVRGTANNNEMILDLRLCLLQEEMPESAQYEISVTTQWTDNAAQLKAKIVAVILATAAANNYNELTSQNVLIPQYNKG